MKTKIGYYQASEEHGFDVFAVTPKGHIYLICAPIDGSGEWIEERVTNLPDNLTQVTDYEFLKGAPELSEL